MQNRTRVISQKIAKTASLLADPGRVEDLISILGHPYVSASEMPIKSKQDFSTRVKRLAMLERHGLLTSWRTGPYRRFNAIKRDETVAMLNNLLEFSKRIPNHM